MRALLDVNMLLGMFDPAHAHHAKAHAWWAGAKGAGWASCPTTQGGFLRIISLPAYPKPIALDRALAILTAQTQQADHEFWADDIAIVDSARIDHAALSGPRQITDTYLLALAVKNGGRLVTLDTRIQIAPVRHAGPANLVIV